MVVMCCSYSLCVVGQGVRPVLLDCYKQSNMEDKAQELLSTFSDEELRNFLENAGAVEGDEDDSVSGAAGERVGDECGEERSGKGYEDGGGREEKVQAGVNKKRRRNAGCETSS